MIRIKYLGHRPEYLDFPKDCKPRSCKGALHLLPGRYCELTKEEYEYILKHFKWIRLSKVPGLNRPKKVKKEKKVKEDKSKNEESSEDSSGETDDKQKKVKVRKKKRG